MGSEASSISVVICTYNRAEWLVGCVQSVAEQTGERDDIEIVVVDNNSTDATRDAIEQLHASIPRLHYLFEPRQGLAYARNCGVEAANGDWICFLDDDARALAGFVEQLRYHVNQGEFACVGGVFEAWYPDGRIAWFRDAYASNAGLAREFGELDGEHYASGGVMLVNKNVMIAAGGFDIAIGMNGACIGYGEETRLQVRLRALGYRIAFDPDWRVAHRVTLVKQSVLWQLRSAWAGGRDCWAVYDRQPVAGYLARLAVRVVTRALRGMFQELRAGQQRRAWQNVVLAGGIPAALTTAELFHGVRRALSRRATRRVG